MNGDINFNYNQCVKSINNIGNTVYQNICNGKTETVNWGQGDWMTAVFGLFILLAFIILIGFMFLRVIRDSLY